MDIYIYMLILSYFHSRFILINSCAIPSFMKQYVTLPSARVYNI